MAQRTELWTRSFVFDAKRYHIDLQENARGIYIKLTEVRQTGERSSIIMPSAILIAFRAALDRTIDEDYARPAGGSGPGGRSTQLCSKLCQAGPKRFFFDTMENERGRFLKVSEVIGRARTVVILPESGFLQVKRALGEMEESAAGSAFCDAAAPLRSMPTGNPQLAGTSGGTRASRSMDLDQKRFFFDLQENDRGRCCKVSEVQRGVRQTVIIPREVWDPLAQLLELFVDEDLDQDVESVRSLPVPAAEAGRGCLKSCEIASEQSKKFFVDLKENSRGRFLKLSEVNTATRRRNSVFIPDSGFEGFKQALMEFGAVVDQLPN